MAKTRKIGERFEYKGKTLEVKECKQWYSCNGCYFGYGGHPHKCYDNNMKALEETGECNGRVREDNTYVYFSLIRNEAD